MTGQHHTPRPPGGRRWILPFFVGVVVGLVVAFVLLTIVVVSIILGLTAQGVGEMPKAVLRVADDGCGVIRTNFGGNPPEGLQWVVTDKEGFQVLGRNALGETRYRFYGIGEYRVVLEAFDGEKYAPVSNRVEIQCP